MGYDAMAHDASSPSAARDAKKKRGNRSAKLKQSKLDVRREQWLSLVKDGKEVKAVVSPGAAAGANSGSPILASPHPPLPRRRAEIRTREGDPEDFKEDSVGASQDVGSSDHESPLHSPVSYNPPIGCLQQKHCSGNGGGRSFSSGSSAWSSSRSVTDSDDDTGTGAAMDRTGRRVPASPVEAARRTTTSKPAGVEDEPDMLYSTVGLPPHRPPHAATPSSRLARAAYVHFTREGCPAGSLFDEMPKRDRARSLRMRHWRPSSPLCSVSAKSGPERRDVRQGGGGCS